MDRFNKIVVTDITEIITVSSCKGRFEKINDRECYGLSFCEEGQITYTHNGIKYISDPKHAIILPKGQSYTLYGDKAGIFPVINFKCMNFLCDTMFVIPVKHIDPLMNDFKQMKSLSVFEGNRTKIISIFYNLIYKLSYINHPDADILAPAMQYLEKNYTCPHLTNEVLANLCNISEVYFRRLFIKRYGNTPKQYILDSRMNRAKQLLIDGTLKMNAISEKSGFSNPYHFCRLFKERTGLTPTEYMKQNRVFKI